MSFLRFLALGLILGAIATWFVLRPASPRTNSGFRSPPLIPPSTWSWRDSALPPPLADADSSSAIAAWHALRAPDGSPADFPLRADALRALLVRLPSASYPRLLAPLARAGLSEDDLALRQIVFSAWIESEPAAAAAWAAAGPELVNLAHEAVSAWSARDPRAAAAWACSLRDEPVARRLAAPALAELAAVDSAQALALASSRGDAFLEALLPSLLGSLAKSDPASAIQTYGPRLWKNGNGFWQLRQVLGDWVARDPSAAIAWIAAQPGGNQREVGRWLGEAASDGPRRLAVANALATVPGISSRQTALASLVHHWVAKDPAAAIAWLDALPDRHLRNSVLERAAQTTYSDRPDLSLPLALAMPEGAKRTERLGQLLGQWAQKDASATLDWLRNNSAIPGVSAASDSVHKTLLATIARDEPATAVAEWQALPDGPLKSRAIADIALAWGQTDPAAALQWASEQGPKLGAIHYQSTELIFAWARKDGPAALRWAESIPDENARRHALNSLAGTWSEKAPRAATADLYAQIKDPALRTRQITDHLQEWLAKDPAAARAWLDSHDTLTPAQAAALLTAKP